MWQNNRVNINRLPFKEKVNTPKSDYGQVVFSVYLGGIDLTNTHEVWL